MIVLGLETSCDETAAALVRDDRAILADIVLSQEAEHRPFGGVVPEIAARAHLHHLDRLIGEALDRAQMTLDQVDAVAASAGPGLIGGLMVATTTGKALALALNKPFVAVNHLEGHALTARLTEGIAFPYLLLLVSGGHCQLLAVEGVGRYRRLGATIDDAAGEAFDKAARLLGLGYPGGPAIERAARTGDPARFSLPRPLLGKPGCDFSFSGLKNALRLLVGKLGMLADQDRADVAASFQAAVAGHLAERTARGLDLFAATHPDARNLVIAGGVAANTALRAALAAVAADHGSALVVPPVRLCTDNGAMIAWAGLERFRLGLVDGPDFAPRPRWPLDPGAAPLIGAGVKA
jgi:N6-L-threonylcarbamoyladenine synthase